MNRIKDRPTFYERNYLCRNVHKSYSNFNVTAQYDDDLRFTRESLSHALSRVISKNPALACNFFRVSGSASMDSASGGMNFRKMAVSQILFSDLVVFVELDHPFGDKELSSLNEKFYSVDQDRALWQLIIYRYKGFVYLTYVTDHLLVDGRSGLNFHKELLSELLDTSDCKDIKSIVFSKSNKSSVRLPSTTDKIDSIMQVPWWYLVSHVARLMVIEPISRLLRQQKPEHFFFDVGIGRPEVVIETFNIPAKVVSSVLATLRKNKLTLSPYICAIGDEAIRRCFLPHIDSSSQICDFQIDVDGRKYLPGSEKALSFNWCVSVVQVETHPNVSIRDSIEKFSEQLTQETKDRRLFRKIGLLQYTDPWAYAATRIDTNCKRATLELSNLGSANIDAHNVWFSQDMGLLAYWVLLAASTAKGGLNLTLAYAKLLKSVINKVTGQPAVDQIGPYLQERFDFLLEQL